MKDKSLEERLKNIEDAVEFLLEENLKTSKTLKIISSTFDKLMETVNLITDTHKTQDSITSRLTDNITSVRNECINTTNILHFRIQGLERIHFNMLEIKKQIKH